MWGLRCAFLSNVMRRFHRTSESGTKPGQLAKTLWVGNSSPGCLCSQGSPESLPCLWGGCLTNMRSTGVERKRWSSGTGLTGRTGSWQWGGTFRPKLRHFKSAPREIICFREAMTLKQMNTLTGSFEKLLGPHKIEIHTRLLGSQDSPWCLLWNKEGRGGGWKGLPILISPAAGPLSSV